VTNEPFFIGLAFLVGQCRRLWSVDPIMGRQPSEHDPTADAIESSPPEATHRFEHRVLDFADDLGWP
jgi:hypothetical protein